MLRPMSICSLRCASFWATAARGVPQKVPFISLPLTLMATPSGATPDVSGRPFALHDIFVRAQLRTAGFANIVIKTFEVAYTFAERVPCHISDGAPTVSAHLQRLDHGERAAFQRSLEARVAERFGMPDGTIRIPNRALIASATRQAQVRLTSSLVPSACAGIFDPPEPPRSTFTCFQLGLLVPPFVIPAVSQGGGSSARERAQRGDAAWTQTGSRRSAME